MASFAGKIGSYMNPLGTVNGAVEHALAEIVPPAKASLAQLERILIVAQEAFGVPPDEVALILHPQTQTPSLATLAQTLLQKLDTTTWGKALRREDKEALIDLLTTPQDGTALRELLIRLSPIRSIDERTQALLTDLKQTIDLQRQTHLDPTLQTINRLATALIQTLEQFRPITENAHKMTTFFCSLAPPTLPQELKDLLKVLKAQDPTQTSIDILQETVRKLLEKCPNDPWVQTLPSHQKNRLTTLLTQFQQTFAAAAPAAEDEFQDVEEDVLHLTTQEARTLYTFLETLTRPRTGPETARAWLGLEAPVDEAAPAAPLPAEPLTYGALFRGIADQALASTSKEVQKALAHSLSFVLDQVHDYLPTIGGEQLEVIKGQLAHIIEGQGSWNAFLGAFGNSLAVLDRAKIHVNGFELPAITAARGTRVQAANYNPSLDAGNANLARLLKRAPTTQNDGMPIPSDRDITEVETSLIKNTTCLLTYKTLRERFLGKAVSPDFYLKELRRINGLEANLPPEQLLKEQFLRELKESGVNWISASFARILWWIFSGAIGSFIQNLYRYHMEQASHYLQEAQANQFSSARSSGVTHFTGYLVKLSGAYEQVAKRERPEGTIQEMLIEELHKINPQERQRVYTEFTHLEISAGMKHRWFTKPLIYLFNKFYGGEKELVSTLSELGVSSLLDSQGYSHALNTLLLEQLKEVLQKLARGERPAGIPELSPEKREEIEGLVKNLFSILPKTSCQTIEELRAAISQTSRIDRLGQLTDGFFIPEVIEKATDLISIILNNLAKEDELKKITFQFATLVNNTYKPDANNLPSQTPKQVQDELDALTERLLTISINEAIDNRFDFAKIAKQKQEITNQNIAQLKQNTNLFCDQMHRFGKQRYRGNPELITTFQTLTTKHIADCVAHQNKIKGIPNFPQAHQNELLNIFTHSKTQMDTIQQALNPLVEIDLEEQKYALEHAVISQQERIWNEIDLLVSQERPDVVALERSILELKRIPRFQNLIDDLASLLKAQQHSLKVEEIFVQIDALQGAKPSAALKKAIAALPRSPLQDNLLRALKSPQDLAPIQVAFGQEHTEALGTLQETIRTKHQIHKQEIAEVRQAHRATEQAHIERLRRRDEGIALLMEHLGALELWNATLNSTQNFNNISLPFGAQGLIDRLRDIVFNRLQEKARQLGKVMRSKTTYQEGIINDVMLKPYVTYVKTHPPLVQ